MLIRLFPVQAAAPVSFAGSELASTEGVLLIVVTLQLLLVEYIVHYIKIYGNDPQNLNGTVAWVRSLAVPPCTVQQCCCGLPGGRGRQGAREGTQLVPCLQVEGLVIQIGLQFILTVDAISADPGCLW